MAIMLFIIFSNSGNTTDTEMVLPQEKPKPPAGRVEKAPILQTSRHQIPPPSERDIYAMKDESIEFGYTPTQEVGEKGSSGGILRTNYPMKYAETKYERLPDTPLIIFTDDMIWKEGNTFIVKKDAIHDQAVHIQEASISLSVAPRLRNGQIDGYQLVEVPKNTLFDKLGLVSGDAIVRINGGKPDMEAVALSFVNMLDIRGMTEIEVENAGKHRIIAIKTSNKE